MSNKTIETTYSDANYWDERWNVNEIAFHKSTNHPFLEKNIDKLVQNRSSIRILFPFCGKEVDMAWLASIGHKIVGVEFVQIACEQFFAENNLKYTVEDVKDFKLFTSEDKKIKIYCGDFFKFTTQLEEPFDCVWDRGALVALPADLRIKYSEHIQSLLNSEFRYLLDTYEYDQELYPGPPHSVRIEEVEKLYGLKCKIELIESAVHSRPFNDNLTNDKLPLEKLYLLTNF